LGAIFPPMIYTVVALRCLGVADDAPEMRWALRQLDDLMIEEGDAIRLQPCVSPVWDTALALNALSIAGVAGSDPALQRATNWLTAREIRRRGDWSATMPDVEASGWCFEYRNGFYPDVDDTAMVLMGLARTGQETSAGARPAVERALRWMLALQNRDGGWAAFDRDINREILTRVPFADHNAMLDPSCPDITARVLEALGQYGYGPGQPPIDRALDFLRRTQEKWGAWPGRWGVNYLYGTWQVLAGLEAIGIDPADPMVRRAADWLEQVQLPSGAWGESCRSYDDPAWIGRGDATASQSAWALLGLICAGRADGSAAQRGRDWLLTTQRADGGWDEEAFTGTGFPKVFYLKYHLYSLYFPLMALARCAAAQEDAPRPDYRVEI
jgi:squalene-hopene/tetraprenyl-beta-curcumene cyclase